VIVPYVFHVQVLVGAVEKVCFGDQGELHGSRTLSSTPARACLALGSLVKHLDASGQHQQAHRLADRLEAWLDKHGEGRLWRSVKNGRILVVSVVL
jgi:hypothetical protein